MNKIEVGKKYRVTRSARENGNVIEIYKMTKDSAYYDTLVGVNKSQHFFGLNSDFCKGLIPYDEDENAKFKVGDRVRAVKEYGENKSIVGKVGTIKHITGDTPYKRYAVEFDETIRNGHACNKKGKSGHCWWCDGNVIELEHENNKIIITADGKTTTAKMYSGKTLVKSAKADCHPDDEFDFNIGATIALERLTGYVLGQLESTLEEEHFYNGKVVCVKNENLESYFTVGKIYDVVDGLLKADVKDRQLDNIRSIDYLNSVFSGNRLKFLEIVE